MYEIITLLTFASSGFCATYGRYDTTDQYSNYQTTMSNLYNQDPYKTATNDIAIFPKDGTRNSGYSTKRYDTYYSTGVGSQTSGYYSTPRYAEGYGNSYYSTPRYGEGVSTGYGSGYTGSYGSGNSGSYGSGYTGSYGKNYGSGLGNSYGSGLGNSYGSGLGNSYGSGLGNSYGSGLGNSYGSGLGNSYGSSYGNNYGSGLGNTYGSSYGNSYGSGLGNNYGGAYGKSYGSSYGSGYSSYERPLMNNIGEYCVNRAPQNGIWVDGLMGMWYGVQVIEHLGGYSRAHISSTCVVVHISEPAEQPSTENGLYHVQHIKAKFRQEFRHIRMLWDEAGKTIEYALYFRNDSAGYWQALSGQNGTLTKHANYQQFSGTIQVLKAEGESLVLNFCQEATNGRPSQLYSVLFSREPRGITSWEIESVHTMLQSKRLSIASRRSVCGNTGHRHYTSAVFSVITCALACLIGKSLE